MQQRNTYSHSRYLMQLCLVVPSSDVTDQLILSVNKMDIDV